MISLSIDSSGLTKKLKSLSKDIDYGAKEYIDELARNSTAMMARRVQPFGVSNSQKEILEKAVYKDINKVYKDNPRVYNKLKKDVSIGVASGYMRAAMAGDYEKAEKIARTYIDGYQSFISSDSEGSKLDSYRSKNSGRVEKDVSVVVTDMNFLDELKIKKAKSIGLVKSAFMEISSKFGRKTRVPAWLRKKSSIGDIYRSSNKLRYSVIVHNKIRYSRKLISNTEIHNCIKRTSRQLMNILKKRFAKYSK